MYRENSETVFPMKKQTIVAKRNESGMTGPALNAMIGNVNTTLVAGAMCVTPWKTSSESPRELRRSWGCAFGLVISALTWQPPLANDNRRTIRHGLLATPQIRVFARASRRGQNWLAAVMGNGERFGVNTPNNLDHEGDRRSTPKYL
jgi:hypothetical protein